MAMMSMKPLSRLLTISLLALIGISLNGCAYLGLGSRPLSELTQKYTDQTSRFVSVEDLVIHYQDEGQGEVVLMLHGEHSSLHVWDAWADKLSQNFRVVRLDLPGHGLTGPAKNDKASYDLEYMLNIVDEFMVKLGLDELPIHMVGASYGGFVTWNYALQNPGMLDSMVLVDATGFDQELHDVLSYNTIPVLAGLNSMTLPRYKVKSRLETLYYEEDRITKDVVRQTQDMMLRQGNRDAFIQVARQMKDQLEEGNNESDQIKYIETPALVMWGEADEWTQLRIMKQFKTHLPNMTLVSYEGVGHLPMQELPVQSSRDVASYLMYGELAQLPGGEKQGW